MDDLSATVAAIAGLLNDEGVPFHVTGGLASSFYGEPRFTQDVDVVICIDPSSAAFGRLLSAMSERFLVDVQTARVAAKEGLLQALDRDTMIKVDLHVGEAIAGELRRSVLEEVLAGVEVPLVSREDAILSKLVWIKQGSHKSRADVTAMLLRPGPVDWPYLSGTARELGVESILEELSPTDRF